MCGERADVGITSASLIEVRSDAISPCLFYFCCPNSNNDFIIGDRDNLARVGVSHLSFPLGGVTTGAAECNGVSGMDSTPAEPKHRSL